MMFYGSQSKETVSTFRSPHSDGETGDPCTRGTTSLMGERRRCREVTAPGRPGHSARCWGGHLGQGPLCGCSNHRGLHGGGGIRAGLGKKGRIWRKEQRPHAVAWAVPTTQNGPSSLTYWPCTMSVLALLSCGWPERGFWGFWASLSLYTYGQVTPAP